MHAPSHPEFETNILGVINILFGSNALSQRAMVARAKAGITEGSEGPSVLTVAPLLRASGTKGKRVVLLGHSRVVVQDFDRVAVESFVSNAWVEGRSG